MEQVKVLIPYFEIPIVYVDTSHVIVPKLISSIYSWTVAILSYSVSSATARRLPYPNRLCYLLGVPLDTEPQIDCFPHHSKLIYYISEHHTSINIQSSPVRSRRPRAPAKEEGVHLGPLRTIITYCIFIHLDCSMTTTTNSATKIWHHFGDLGIFMTKESRIVLKVMSKDMAVRFRSYILWDLEWHDLRYFWLMLILSAMV